MSQTAQGSALPKTVNGRRAGTAVRTILTTFSVVTMLLLAAAAACTSRESKETPDSLRQKSETLRDRQRLRIGVREDVPKIFWKEENGKRTGFEIELAKEMARELGYTEDRIDWILLKNLEDRIIAVQRGSVDMVVASVSMTDERATVINFAGPYLIVPQALLAHKGDNPSYTIADLRAQGIRVCVTTSSTSEEVLKKHNVIVEPRDTNEDCMDGMRKRTYDVFSTDLHLLAGLLSAEESEDSFVIQTPTIGSYGERLGFAVHKDDTAMRDLIAYHLHRWRGQGESSPWLLAYDRTIRTILDPKYRSQPRVDNPPDLADFDAKTPRN